MYQVPVMTGKDTMCDQCTPAKRVVGANPEVTQEEMWVVAVVRMVVVVWLVFIMGMVVMLVVMMVALGVRVVMVRGLAPIYNGRIF